MCLDDAQQAGQHGFDHVADAQRLPRRIGRGQCRRIQRPDVEMFGRDTFFAFGTVGHQAFGQPGDGCGETDQAHCQQQIEGEVKVDHDAAWCGVNVRKKAFNVSKQ